MARLPKQPKPEFNFDSILNNPVDARKLKEFIDYSCEIKGKIEVHAADLKQQRDDAKENLGIPPALFNTLVKAKFNDGISAEKEKVDQADLALYKLWGIMGSINPTSNGPVDGDVDDEADEANQDSE